VADERVEEVPAGRAGVRLDQFLCERLGLSRAQVRRLLDEGVVTLSERVLGLVDKGRSLPAGARLRIGDFRPPQSQLIRPEAPSDEGTGEGAEPDLPRILARGEGWLALDKPAGMPVHPLRESETGTLLNQVAARFPQVQGVGEGGLRSGVVHRLDVDTSGVMLVATSRESWQRLRAAFREHRIAKSYRAIVRGRFESPLELRQGLVVARHRPARVKVVALEEPGKTTGVWISQQRVIPLESLSGATLVEVRPRTGFLHQIRATLAHLGHPVIGDRTYEESPERAFEVPRHMLHAARIGFEEIEAESPDPEDFNEVLARLRA
jgi:23S rRNA pseudouridine1911/1915/1917 synthase